MEIKMQNILWDDCYEFGIGTNVDYKKAFSIYERINTNRL